MTIKTNFTPNMTSDEEILKDNLVASCYTLINFVEKKDTIESIAVNMIQEGIGDVEFGILAAFIQKILNFYASDEAVPLLEESIGNSKISTEKEEDTFVLNSSPLFGLEVADCSMEDFRDDCPSDVIADEDSYAEPTDDDLLKIEQSSDFLQNLWETADDEVADFSMGGLVKDSEPDFKLLILIKRIIIKNINMRILTTKKFVMNLM